ncbi:MAG TPA: hypothetical protein VL966_05580 [Alphaproteobacteria bacterium]|nr:hypothetical protein [Alphaproteobacteria bacterium]
MVSIISGDLTLDEAAGVHATDNDIDYATWAAAHSTLVTHLNTLQHPAVTSFPQVAERDDMINVTGLSGLALKVNGTEPLSTGFTDEAGNLISLATDPSNANIILGKTSNGDVSFAVILDATDTGPSVTDAKVYMVLYEPLKHTGTDLIDDADQLDLTGKINLQETTTTTTTDFLPLDFSKIPSGSPVETLTVPTTSTTDNHNILFDGLIFPTGAVANPTSVPTNPGTDDDLNPDSVGFGVKGGQASQMNQNEGFVARDAAWVPADAATNNNEIAGLRFDIQGIGNLAAVNIEWWSVDNGVVIDHVNDTVTLPKGNSVFENYTMDASQGVDGIYVRFTYAGGDTNAGVRLENFETRLESTSTSENTVSEDLGAHLKFEDDGPTIGSQATGTKVDFSAGSDTGDVALTNLSMGVDKPGEVYFTSLPSGWTADDTADTTPNAATDSTGTFHIVIDNDSYKFSVLKDPVLSFQSLNFAAVPSGSPQETLSVPTTSTTDNHSVLFNGLIFPTGIVTDPTTVPKDSGTNDDLNPDSVGFGVKGGQASQMNPNEGFFAQDAAWNAAHPDDNEIFGLRFDIQGIGNQPSVTIEWWTVDNGVVIDHETDTIQLPKGNAVFENFEVSSNTSFDQVYYRFTFPDGGANDGVRLENFDIKTPNPVPDQTFTFGINAVDQDGDHAVATTFSVGVDGNHDGLIS